MFRARKTIDEKKWERYIDRPDWYLKLLPDYKRLTKRTKNDPELKAKLKEQTYAFFEKHLMEDNITLGKNGPDWDKERKPIQNIVIHHTANPSGMNISRLEAMHLLRLYASYYINPSKVEKHIKGTPLWSGHFMGGKQVFRAYHWMIRTDGTVERLLEDEMIGWQSGNWEMNTKSMAICLDGDFRDTSPSDKMLQAVRSLISKHYPEVLSENIIGHKEVNTNTTCPGEHFLKEWKQKIIE